MKKQQHLEKDWEYNPQKEIVSDCASYKINPDRFLGRGGFGVVYQGIRKRIIDKTPKYDLVAIKQFKKSQKWKDENDKDKELVILERFSKELDPKYILAALQIFQHKETRQYYLVTSWCSGGNLTERMRSIKSQRQIYQFLTRMAQILHHIHYEVLEHYRVVDESADKNNNSEKLGILHRDVKPANIVYQGRQQSSLYLLDFGVSKVAYRDKYVSYNNCGTNNYKAPQINQGKPYNCKSDIYGLGCTLYEILNGGVKLIGSAGVGTKFADRQKHVTKKLQELNYRLISMKPQNATTNPIYWMQILNKCLAHNPKDRFSSKQLLYFLKSNDFRAGRRDRLWYFGDLTEQQRANRNKFQLYLINFQIFRLSVIQDKVFGLFQYVYFEEPSIQKFTFYVIMKYVTIFFNDRLKRVKEQAIYISKQKSNHIINVIEGNKMQDIQAKATEKLERLVEKERLNNGREARTQLQNYIQRYPELLFKQTAQPRKTLYEFCYQKRYQLIQYQKIGNMLAFIMMMMDEWDYYVQLKLEPKDFQNSQAEIVSIRKHHKLLTSIENKIRQDGLQNIYQSCRVQNSPISHLNKEQNKTDIKIQKVNWL